MAFTYSAAPGSSGQKQHAQVVRRQTADNAVKPNVNQPAMAINGQIMPYNAQQLGASRKRSLKTAEQVRAEVGRRHLSGASSGAASPPASKKSKKSKAATVSGGQQKMARRQNGGGQPNVNEPAMAGQSLTLCILALYQTLKVSDITISERPDLAIRQSGTGR